MPSSARSLPNLVASDDVVAAALDGAAHEPFVGEGAVHVGGIEEVEAEVERALDGGERLVVVPAGIEVRHPHAAEAERGHAQPAGTEDAVGELGHGAFSWVTVVSMTASSS